MEFSNFTKKTILMKLLNCHNSNLICAFILVFVGLEIGKPESANEIFVVMTNNQSEARK